MKEDKKAEKMIPLYVIDALIEHHEGHGISIDYDDIDVINILKKLKKEAIFVPLSSLEQKIRDKIKELQDEMKAFNKNGRSLHVVELQYGIDELRKLLK